MRVFQCEQYSDDWFRLRLGIPTASAFNNIMTPGGAPTKGERRIKYMYRLVCERLMKQSMEDFSGTYWTKRGERLEQEALDAFVLAQDLEVKFERTGFITSDDGRIGASPDCLIRSPGGMSLGGLEIKCPSPWVQMEYLLAGLGENYAAQVQGQLLISEQEVWHLWSYHPKMPPCHVYTLRDDDYIAKLDDALDRFCDDLDAMTEEARTKGIYLEADFVRLQSEIADDVPGVFPWRN